MAPIEAGADRLAAAGKAGSEPIEVSGEVVTVG